MLINTTFLKKYSPAFPKQYDMTNIEPYIILAERNYVVPVIGQALYDEIQEQVDKDDLSEENATLLVDGCLWQFLAYCVTYLSMPYQWVKGTEAGLQKGKSDNSDSADLKDLTYLSTRLQADINALKQIVIDFLCNHYESYPLFSGEICPCGCGCKKKISSPTFKDLYTTVRKCGDIV